MTAERMPAEGMTPARLPAEGVTAARDGRPVTARRRRLAPMLVLAWGLPVAAARLTVVATDSLSGQPVGGAEVRATSAGAAGAPTVTTYTDAAGRAALSLAPGAWSLRLRHGAYARCERDLGLVADTLLALTLSPVLYRMPERLATAVAAPSSPGVLTVGPAEILRAPAPAPDPLRLLRVLPGVASGGDQAPGAYSVRGGSWDENLVAVEGVALESPQLLRTGLAEVLSPVNGDLVEEAAFHVGVLPVALGDRLSSALEVGYRRPDSLEVIARAGSLRQALAAGARAGRSRWLAGARRVDLSALTRGLQTRGAFAPQYRDLQGVLAWRDAGADGAVFGLASRSRFALTPQSRALRYDCGGGPARPPWGPCNQFRGAAEGDERFAYDLDVLGARAARDLGGVRLGAAAHWLRRQEREDADLTYRADWLPRAGVSAPVAPAWLVSGDSLTGRLEQERLEGSLALSGARGEPWALGLGARRTRVEATRVGRERLVVDGAPVVDRAVDERVDREPIDLSGHGAWSWRRGPWGGAVEARGVRFGGPDEWLLLPRLRLSRQAGAWRLAGAAGLSAQPPLFKELLAAPVVPRSQKGADAVLELERQGTDRRWRWAAFYRRGWDRISYTLDDVAVRYSGRNDSRSAAWGTEALARGLVGRAVGTVSYTWLHAREDLAGDGAGWLPQATDQRHTVAACLEDRMALRMGWLRASRFHLRALYGSGFPFTPRRTVVADGRLVGLADGARHSRRGDPYVRFDMGLAQVLQAGPVELEVREEVANLFDEFNAVGYRQLPAPDGSMALLPRGLGRRVYNAEVSLAF